MPQFPKQGQSKSGANEGRESRPDVEAARTTAPETVPDAMLSFEPDAAARAIVFHVIDEGLAREVVGESVRRMVSRLRRRGLRPVIRRSAWRVMTNAGRLEWLLAETSIVPLMRPDDGVVSLEASDQT